jgi:hypothetical protein
MKIQIIHPDSTIPKSNIKIVERGKIYTTSLFCIGTGTYIKSGGVMLVLWSPCIYNFGKSNQAQF